VWNSAPVTAPHGRAAEAAISAGSERLGLAADDGAKRCDRPPCAPRRRPRLLEIREGARQRQLAIVEHVPGDAARLRAAPPPPLPSSRASRRGSAALRVQLHAAFHHHRPGHQRAVRHHPGAVALVAAEVGQRAPSWRPHRMALPSLPAWPAKVASRISGNSSPHHRLVAAEAVARQQQHVAPQLFQRAIGPLGSRRRARAARHRRTARAPRVDVTSQGARTRDASNCVTSAAPVFSGTACMRMHAMAGIEEPVQHLEHACRARCSSGRSPARWPACRPHQVRRRVPFRLGLDVGREALRAVVDALRRLRARARRRDESRTTAPWIPPGARRAPAARSRRRHRAARWRPPARTRRRRRWPPARAPARPGARRERCARRAGPWVQAVGRMQVLPARLADHCPFSLDQAPRRKVASTRADSSRPSNGV
jgi:hypothetical protein